MADCAEPDADFSLKSCWTSPVTRKRKRDCKRDKKGLKDKSNVTLKKDCSIQKRKKKKKSKYKEVMKAKKDEKKGKKKKKVPLEIDDRFVLTQGSRVSDPVPQRIRPEQITAVTPAASNLCSSTPESLNRDFLPKQKTKNKKKVSFDLSPGYIRVKRPKVVSPPPKSPKDKIPSESKVVGDESLLRGAVTTRQSRSQPQDNDSQGTGDDAGSQDLFITQKTFRASAWEPSSGETHQEGSTSASVSLSQQDRESHTPVSQQHPEELDPQIQAPDKFPYFYEHPRKANGRLTDPLRVHPLLMDKTKMSHTSNQEHKKGPLCFQAHMESHADLTVEAKASQRPHGRPKVILPHLEQPVAGSLFVDVTQPQRDKEIQTSPPPLQPTDEAFLLPLMSRADTSTQTENFFTAELSSYLTFCHQRVTESCEDPRPLDLSLPQRTRSFLYAVKIQDKRGDQEPSSSRVDVKVERKPRWDPSYSSGVKDSNEKEADGHHQWSCSARQRDEPATSPQSEYEPKSSDTLTSSEDNEPNWRSSKMDLTQFRAVQMRLNESFFFKTKGEGRSPRPESPLMKLNQSSKQKSRKSH